MVGIFRHSFLHSRPGPLRQGACDIDGKIGVKNRGENRTYLVEEKREEMGDKNSIFSSSLD